MKIEFPIIINNKKAYFTLMKEIEKEYADLRWRSGHKPTFFYPGVKSFPISVEICDSDFDDRKELCYSNVWR